MYIWYGMWALFWGQNPTPAGKWFILLKSHCLHSHASKLPTSAFGHLKPDKVRLSFGIHLCQVDTCGGTHFFHKSKAGWPWGIWVIGDHPQKCGWQGDSNDWTINRQRMVGCWHQVHELAYTNMQILSYNYHHGGFMPTNLNCWPKIGISQPRLQMPLPNFGVFSAGPNRLGSLWLETAGSSHSIGKYYEKNSLFLPEKF